MKSISASIVVLAAALMITGGSFHQHNDTQITLQLIGGAVGIGGLWFWFTSFKEK